MKRVLAFALIAALAVAPRNAADRSPDRSDEA